MGNSNTEHSRNLRKESAKKSVQKTLKQGGKRINILLNAEEAQKFSALIEAQGGVKKAFLFLLNNY